MPTSYIYAMRASLEMSAKGQLVTLLSEVVLYN